MNVDDERKTLNEILRNPNVSFCSINQMKNEQNMKVSAIKTNLVLMFDVREVLKANRFETFETLDFGILELNEYCLYCLSNSLILSKQQSFDLKHLCEFDINDRFKLLYRATRDGFGAEDFHSKSDGKSYTLSIFQAKEFIFGGFTTVSWESHIPGQCKSDPNAFLFSLTNKENKP